MFLYYFPTAQVIVTLSFRKEKSGKQVLELFDMLNESGVTIVMITHDRKVAERAKRIVHIIDGEISEEGQEVKHEEEKGN